MLLHHTDLMLLISRAATRLENEGKPNDQLIALLGELNKVSEQAEAKDSEIRKLLDEVNGTANSDYWKQFDKKQATDGPNQ